MKTDPNAPASTDMMGIVHSALRRDLTRTTTALTAAHPPGGAQRAALSAHVIWMMDFLHGHHEGEDALLRFCQGGAHRPEGVHLDTYCQATRSGRLARGAD